MRATPPANLSRGVKTLLAKFDLVKFKRILANLTAILAKFDLVKSHCTRLYMYRSTPVPVPVGPAGPPVQPVRATLLVERPRATFQSCSNNDGTVWRPLSLGGRRNLSAASRRSGLGRRPRRNRPPTRTQKAVPDKGSGALGRAQPASERGEGSRCQCFRGRCCGLHGPIFGANRECWASTFTKRAVHRKRGFTGSGTREWLPPNLSPRVVKRRKK